MYFPHNRGGFEQLVLLVFVLSFSTVCRIKIISFCSLKNGKIIKRYLQWLSGMINSLLGALGCRIRIISSLGRYNLYPTPVYLITNNQLPPQPPLQVYSSSINYVINVITLYWTLWRIICWCYSFFLCCNLSNLSLWFIIAFVSHSVFLVHWIEK